MYSIKDDIEIYKYLQLEQKRQIESVEIIASENYVSPAVLEAAGSILTNKYSEGYPGKRYYGGNQYIDQIENLAIQRAQKLFGCNYVNVQPHSGSTANFAIYLALLNPGDTILGMSLTSGGHLTHGHRVSFSGKIYNSIQYSTDVNGFIDYNQVRDLALKYKPKLIVCGFSAYPRHLDYKKFRQIADEVGAYLMADVSHISGMIAGGIFENPVNYCDVVMTTTHKTLRGPRGAIIFTNDQEIAQKIDKAVFPGSQGGPLDHIIMAKAIAFGEALDDAFKFYQNQILQNAKEFEKFFYENDIKMITNGTDNHLLLIDVSSLGIDGLIAEKTLEFCDISCNKNTIPGDKSPFKPSGIRIGTPALTTRGLKQNDIKFVGNLLLKALKNYNNESILLSIKKEVNEFMKQFPIFKFKDIEVYKI